MFALRSSWLTSLLRHLPYWPASVIRWLTRREASVLLALALLVGGAWLFLEIASDVAEGDTLRFDRWAIEVLRRPDDPSRPLGPRWLADTGLEITALGSGSVLALVTAAVLGYLLIQRKRRAAWVVVAATLGGLALSSALKALYHRPRPDLVPHLAPTLTTSFPSGHSMLSAVVYLTLGVLLARLHERWTVRAYIMAIALVLPFLVGVSRVFLGVHYPSDVLAGWTAGLVWAVACLLVARRLQREGVIEQPGMPGVDSPESGPRLPPAGPVH
jgi:undecaprenyl-diphosphatase